MKDSFLDSSEIGPICESRWLTKANRLSRMWVSKHGLSKKNVQKLKLIIEFVIGVYMPNWFNIKVKHSWVEGPRHVLYHAHVPEEEGAGHCQTHSAEGCMLYSLRVSAPSYAVQ